MTTQKPSEQEMREVAEACLRKFGLDPNSVFYSDSRGPGYFTFTVVQSDGWASTQKSAFDLLGPILIEAMRRVAAPQPEYNPAMVEKLNALKSMANDSSVPEGEKEFMEYLAVLQPAQQTDRNAVLEECAQLVESTVSIYSQDNVADSRVRGALFNRANAIRALKSTPPQQPEDK